MKTFLSYLEKVNSITFLLERWLLIIAVVAMVGINFVQVLCRYVFTYSIPWSEQSSVVLFMMMILIGGNLAMKEDGEIKIEIVKFRDAKKDNILRLIVDIIALVVLMLLLISAVLITQQAYKRPQVLSALPLKYYHLYGMMIIGFTLMVIQKLTNIIKKIIKAVGGHNGDVEGVAE
ncbi:TRAP transporter small permease subunit [Petroclostridium sp. X23]|uniref:TRAP transporter small permease n=1 Tax=Petroclostridium sp. X23 TaxID=3045146 RepID=UPI0024AD7E04|nr:TRAP transporter small permease subunit [Petroclostridium sp. X23]WHH57983.1 TRAP transporter small permease subunit [Petroclostridium sp. X23]